MTKTDDPRLIATQHMALNGAIEILHERGLLAVSHATVSAKTGISRSTLYRHWPKISLLRNDAFKLAATPPEIAPKTNGPLHADLTWLLGILMAALNETAWGKIAPQVVSVAATDDEAKLVINDFMQERMASVRSVFHAAQARGEISEEAPIENLIEIAISVPYFRKLIAGLPLDHHWLELHVNYLCDAAKR